MGKFDDLTGKRFGKLTVKYRGEILKKLTRWWCDCDCGNEVLVLAGHLKDGHTKSCGCLNKEFASERQRGCNVWDLTSANYGIGYTQNGKKFYFDIDDYEKIKNYYWRTSGCNEYITTIINDKKIYLHRFVMDCTSDDGRIIDHINHKKYDNRKFNLRDVSGSQNGMNKKLRKDNSSNVTGVSWCSNCNKWRSYITINKETKNLGYYEKFEDAVRARKHGEDEYYGNYSFDNSMNISNGY